MSNTLDAVIPRLLAKGMLALRGACIMPRLVNNNTGVEPSERGKNIDVPVPAHIAVQDVAPANTAPATGDIQPSYVQVPLTSWKEAPFYMSDADMGYVMDGFLPMQVTAAIASLAEQVNSDIFGCYKDVFGFSGTPGTTPFSGATSYSAADTKPATDVGVILDTQKCPVRDRNMVLSPAAWGAAANLRAFQDQSWKGQPGLIDGQLGDTLGFRWFKDQQVPTHTAGTLTGTVTVNGVQAAGTPLGYNSTGVLSVATAAGAAVNLKKGDILLVTGQTQTYTVTADTTIGASTTGNVPIAPALQAATAGGEAVTVKASHVVNLAFHPMAFAFASRPLADNVEGLGNKMLSTVDPISGLTLRLEVSREHKRTRWSFDMLYGMKCIRPELACRFAG